jgi:hypothetical protein
MPEPRDPELSEPDPVEPLIETSSRAAVVRHPAEAVSDGRHEGGRTVRFIMFTYAGPERIADWEAMSAAEMQDDIGRVIAWFRANDASIDGGEELGEPARSKVIRKRGITDGPFIETKEMLGGFIILEVESEAQALAIASGWPGLVHDTDRVEVWPVGSAEAEATAKARSEAAGQQETGTPSAAG